jgi:hypothetical protein
MLKILASLVLLLGMSMAQAFSPQAGVWIVQSELDGKPGRGMGIDVQNDIFVMQMYAYESSGQPTFYLAVGPMVNNEVTTSLNRYVGGRYFGGPARSGTQEKTVGQVKMRFTSGVTGYATFPGEPEVAIIRGNFGYAAVQSSLKGVWSLTSVGSAGVTADAVLLEAALGSSTGGNGVMASFDRLFACEHQTSGSAAGLVLCVKLNAQGSLLRAYMFAYSVNEGEGLSGASGSSLNQLLSVRRLTTPAGVGTGLVIKQQPDTTVNDATLMYHLTELAKSEQVRP